MTTSTNHIKARSMTESLCIKLKWATDLTTTALSSWRFGLAQFWNQKPGYYDEYMKIYKMSRILSLTVNVTVISLTALTPAEIVMCVLPYSDYSRTLAEVKQLPKAKYRFISGAGGIDKATLTYSGSLNRALSVDSRAIRDYQQSASEAASTLALLPDTPIIALYVGGASTEPNLRVFIEVLYSIEFFEPEYPGSVAFTQSCRLKPTDRTGCAVNQLDETGHEWVPIIHNTSMNDQDEWIDDQEHHSLATKCRQGARPPSIGQEVAGDSFSRNGTGMLGGVKFTKNVQNATTPILEPTHMVTRETSDRRDRSTWQNLQQQQQK